MAIGKKAQVTVLDKSLRRLEELDFQFGGRLNTAYSTESSIEYYVTDADLVVGAVLVAGHSAPQLVQRDMLKKMRSGSVISRCGY